MISIQYERTSKEFLNMTTFESIQYNIIYHYIFKSSTTDQVLESPMKTYSVLFCSVYIHIVYLF